MSRIRLIAFSTLATLALGVVTASSAAAFAWWIETGEGKEEILKLEAKEPFNSAATVAAPFKFKWKKEFEVSCEAASYQEAFLEGTVKLGAKSITFTKCKVMKPAGCKIKGEEIKTAALKGEIRQVGTAVEFILEPVTGTLVAKFEIEAVGVCAKKNVEITGRAKGEIPNASELTKEKFFLFQNKPESLEIEKTTLESTEGKVGYTSVTKKGWSAH
ncbi:MAG TPA: hypothetical protein VGG08_10545 [Solirubrobacteraceae bacterium]